MLGAALVGLLLSASCASNTLTPGPATSPPSPPSSPSERPTASMAPVASASPTVPGSPSVTAIPGGFAFAADAIVGYYESIGYTCSSGQPSPRAAGFSVRTCSFVDPAGRRRDIDVVTDSSGLLGAAVARMTGTSGESILDPSVALEPMAAFAGALLGAEPGAALVPWLAAHLGDARSQTTSGRILVETYLDTPSVHSAINVALSAPAYVQAVATAAP